MLIALLNQVRAFVQEVGMCARVCVPPGLVKAIYVNMKNIKMKNGHEKLKK